MNVANRKCVRHLSFRSLRANRTRNLVAVLAIVLTTVLFTSLFTIALSINEGIQQSNFRQAGGWSHGTFKYLTEEQFEELKDDPLIKSWGLRRFLGMPTDVPFNKSHVEVGYSDANQAHWMYCDPIEGRLPKEGTDEAATDTHVLALLGVEPKLGTQFTVTFSVDGHETTQTFTLCGWWDYDEAIVANHILIPESRVDAVLQEVGVTPPGSDGMTGDWNLDVMLKNGDRSIEGDLNQILANHGYQSETAGADYIALGINWGYTGAQLSENMDPTTLSVIVVILVLIIFTGYLIIYNVFQISVTGDIQFYGLLKTIGTTPRQLRRIIRTQALILSLIGIPIGLLLGWLLGSRFAAYITAVDHWIAFALLVLLGINMIREARCPDEEDTNASLAFRVMLPMAVATSIDALAVGITFAFLDVAIIPAVSFIGMTTFCLSAAGVKVGNVFGSRYESRAELAGGIILILLGGKILLEHLGILG